MFKKSEIKKIIDKINQYDAGCIGKNDEYPFVVVGPSGGSNNLRIYCYGGNAGCVGAEEIDTDEKYPVEYELISKKYERFLRRYYEDGQNSVYTLNKNLRKRYKTVLSDAPYETKPEKAEYLEGKEKPRYIPGLDEDFLAERRKKEETIYREILKKRKSSKYLDYVIAASENKFMNTSSANANRSMGERKVQTKIVKKYMQASKLESKGYIVVDMEYNIKLDKDRFCKPDLIVFDGKRIGLVEIKYAGESMDEKASNSLRKHYNDFYEIMYSESFDRQEIAKECWRRMHVLSEYNLIHEDWKPEISAMNKTYTTEELSSLFWMGFLFVEGTGEGKNDNEVYVKEQMNKQLGNYLSEDDEHYHADIRYFYTKQNELELDMNQNREYIVENIIKPFSNVKRQ